MTTSCTVLLAALLLQNASKEPRREDVLKKVDAQKVEQAIAKGVSHLNRRVEEGLKIYHHPKQGDWRYDDIVFITLVHAGVPPEDKAFRATLQKVLDGPLERTYYSALQAMAFLKLDKARYQWRIAQCTQMLVDNQAGSGGWSYGEAVPVDQFKPSAARPGTAALERITIRKNGKGTGTADGSNSQYAAMGLRAAADAQITVPLETLTSAVAWWEKGQAQDGGWGYKNKYHEDPYGSMTAGGLSSVSAFVYMIGSAPRLDPRLTRARQWLAQNWSVTEVPGADAPPTSNIYYYLYSLERAGTLYGTEIFGTHEWYVEGARHLLDNQNGDGSWGKKIEHTCFAILFLRRSTDDFRPPVATEDSKR